jgi:hypothetical protein
MFYFTAEALWRPLMSLNDSACNIAMQEEDHGAWAVQSESQVRPIHDQTFQTFQTFLWPVTKKDQKSEKSDDRV